MENPLDRALKTLMSTGAELYSRLDIDQQKSFVDNLQQFATRVQSLDSSPTPGMNETRLGVDLSRYLNQLIRVADPDLKTFSVVLRMLGVPEPDPDVERPVSELPDQPVRNRFIEYVSELPEKTPPTKPETPPPSGPDAR